MPFPTQAQRSLIDWAHIVLFLKAPIVQWKGQEGRRLWEGQEWKSKGYKEETLINRGIREGACEQVEPRESLGRDSAAPGCRASTSERHSTCQRGFGGRYSRGWRHHDGAMGHSWGNNSPKCSFEELPWGEASDLCAPSGSTTMNLFLENSYRDSGVVPREGKHFFNQGHPGKEWDIWGGNEFTITENIQGQVEWLLVRNVIIINAQKPTAVTTIRAL